MSKNNKAKKEFILAALILITIAGLYVYLDIKRINKDIERTYEELYSLPDKIKLDANSYVVYYSKLKTKERGVCVKIDDNFYKMINTLPADDFEGSIIYDDSGVTRIWLSKDGYMAYGTKDNIVVIETDEVNDTCSVDY